MTTQQAHYVGMAALLHAASRFAAAYRRGANVLGGRIRTWKGLPEHYVQRAQRFLEWCRTYDAVHDGDRALEVGTGWVHWESIILRLFYDVQITLFDVWDNRQLAALRRYACQLEARLDELSPPDPSRAAHARRMLPLVAGATSFEALYRMLDMTYVVDPGGSLARLDDGAYGLLYSYSVLQHVRRDMAAGSVHAYSRVLAPGGTSIHWIDLGDQLVYLAGLGALCEKSYLRYSDDAWGRFFDNGIVCFNRIQRPGWLDMFRQAGLELVHEETLRCDLGDLPIARQYADLNRADLETVKMLLIHRKPG